MDPFMEAFHLWEDFHNKLISEIERTLAPTLPDRYLVRTPERSYVAVAEVEGEQTLSLLPDVAISSRSASHRPPRKSKQSTARGERQTSASAVLMRALVREEYHEPFIEIRQVGPEHKLVTALEVLSPSNKRPGTKGWRVYRRKRLAFLSGHANFVEIDLLRQGKRMPMVSQWPDSPYYLLVCRKKEAPQCTVWPAFMTTPLPVIPIPLLPPDADVNLDLQPLIEAVYTRSRYGRDIDYRRAIEPPLSEDEAECLKSRATKRE
jgi:hypothetical protein